VTAPAASPGGRTDELGLPLDRGALRRFLDPDERFAEVLFGLIMVVTITGTISVTEGGRQDVREMLVAALGCNLAWGIADAVMWILTTLVVRGRGLVALRAIRAEGEARRGHALIARALPPTLADLLGPAELEAMRQRVLAAPEPPRRPSLGRDDLFAALGVCVLVFASTFPVVIPFFFVTDAKLALRISNGIAIAMLFLLGRAAARHGGGRPWRFGLAMVALGCALVAAIVALGG
jgi:hypothetical protein